MGAGKAPSAILSPLNSSTPFLDEEGLSHAEETTTGWNEEKEEESHQSTTGDLLFRRPPRRALCRRRHRRQSVRSDRSVVVEFGRGSVVVDPQTVRRFLLRLAGTGLERRAAPGPGVCRAFAGTPKYCLAILSVEHDVLWSARKQRCSGGDRTIFTPTLAISDEESGS